MSDIIFVANSNLLRLNGLKNESTGQFVNSGATVEVTLLDDEDNQVTGATWPISLTYVTDSDGNYEATLPSGLAISPTRCYTALVTADAGGGLVAQFETPLKAVKRT